MTKKGNLRHRPCAVVAPGFLFLVFLKFLNFILFLQTGSYYIEIWSLYKTHWPIPVVSSCLCFPRTGITGMKHLVVNLSPQRNMRLRFIFTLWDAQIWNCGWGLGSWLSPLGHCFSVSLHSSSWQWGDIFVSFLSWSLFLCPQYCSYQTLFLPPPLWQLSLFLVPAPSGLLSQLTMSSVWKWHLRWSEWKGARCTQAKVWELE